MPAHQQKPSSYAEVERDESAVENIKKALQKQNEAKHAGPKGRICSPPVQLAVFIVLMMSGALAWSYYKTLPDLTLPEFKVINDGRLIRRLNARVNKFKTGPVKLYTNWTESVMKETLGGIFWTTQLDKTAPCLNPEHLPVEMPPAFNARTEWPDCFALNHYTSEVCSASWAVAVATTLSNRACIVDPENRKGIDLSPQQLLSCDPVGLGCEGAAIDTMWVYAEKEGLITSDCIPWKGTNIVPCGKRETGCKEAVPVKSVGRCRVPDDNAIMREVMANGPVVGVVSLHDDFLLYKNGIYKPDKESEKLLKNDQRPITHTVKIIGWGKDQGDKYWLIEGCGLGSDWGDNGVMKLSRNSVDVLISRTVMAPIVTKQSANSEKSLEAEYEEAERKRINDERRRQREEEEERKKASGSNSLNVDANDPNAAQTVVDEINKLMGKPKQSGDDDDDGDAETDGEPDVKESSEGQQEEPTDIAEEPTEAMFEGETANSGAADEL